MMMHPTEPACPQAGLDIGLGNVNPQNISIVRGSHFQLYLFQKLPDVSTFHAT